MSVPKVLQGARLLGRINRPVTGVLQAQYSGQKQDYGGGRKQYERQQQQKTKRKVGQIAATAAVAAAAITYSYKDSKEDKKVEIQSKKPAKKVSTDESDHIQELIEEENRIRQHSPPDKVFNYFASYQVKDHKGNKEVMMSPLDLYNAITPSNTLVMSCGPGVYTEVTIDELPEVTSKLEQAPDPDNDSVLNVIGKKGLLSYNDFCVLITLLSTPKRYIDTVFQLFDVTGEGTVCAKEFAYVSTYMSYKLGGFGQYTEVDQAEILASNSGLLSFLFGNDRNTRVTKQEFYDFQTNLLDEIIELQFREYDKNHSGRIS